MRVLITGAGGGIGAACAMAFAEAGAQLILSDVAAPEYVMEAAALAGAEAVTAHACDVADAEAVAALFVEAEAQMKGLDVAVHCAGVIHEAPLLETTLEDFDRVISINLRGSFLVGQAAVRLMLKQSESPARLILIASDLAYYGRETFSPYVASKHGVLGLARSWAKEFAPHILVNAICPGPIDTVMLGAANMSDEWRAKELAIPLERFGAPSEVASFALYLSGDGGRYFTGQGLGINGGSVMP